MVKGLCEKMRMEQESDGMVKDLRIVDLMKTGFKWGVEKGCFAPTLKRQLTEQRGRVIKFYSFEMIGSQRPWH